MITGRNIDKFEVAEKYGVQSEQLENFSDRKDCFMRPDKYLLFDSTPKAGSIYSFPDCEKDIEVYAFESHERVIRLVRVRENNSDFYFPLAALYCKYRDSEGNVLTSEFSKELASLDSDKDIIRHLLAHSVKCVEGKEFNKMMLDRRIVKTRVMDFVLLDPPLNEEVWYQTDDVGVYDASGVYESMSAQLESQLHNRYGALRTYLENRHSMREGQSVAFFLENGCQIDDEGRFTALLALKSDGKYTVLRDVHMDLYPSMFLERRRADGACTGIHGVRRLITLETIITPKRMLAIDIMRLPDGTARYRFIPRVLSRSDIEDDIGKLSFFRKEDSFTLKADELPVSIWNYPYNLVGVQYHAPYSNIVNQYCILFAIEDNPYDANAVEVKRWFPARAGQRPLHDGIYEWGFISRYENAELHRYMTANSSRVLFGKTDRNGKVRIIGGVSEFVNGALREYVIPRPVFERI